MENLQISFHGMDSSEAVEQRIREKMEKLERLHGGITNCRVTVEAPNKHQRSGNPYNVHLEIHVPGTVIAIVRDHPDPAHEDIYVAIRDAFEAAQRQLGDYARKRRGDVKRHTLPGTPED